MTTKTIDEEVQEMVAARQAYDKLMAEKGSALIKRIIARMFEVGGGVIHTIAWDQYAPGFNDGDPCVFSVYGRGFYGKDEEICYYEDAKGFNQLTEAQQEEIMKLDRALDCIDDDVFIESFSDDCRVQATLVNSEVVFNTEYVYHD